MPGWERMLLAVALGGLLAGCRSGAGDAARAVPAAPPTAAPQHGSRQAPAADTALAGTLCAANLKYLSAALAQYVQDYDGRYPPRPEPRPLTTSLARYLPHLAVPWACSRATVTPSYALTGALAATARRSLPAGPVVALFESDDGHTVAARHRGGGYYAFTDGHVTWSKTVPAARPTPAKAKPAGR